MGLRHLKEAINSLARSTSTKALFQNAKARHPALAGHETAEAVLAALADESEAGWTEREALTRALLAEAQARRDPFWAALLVSAYYPMLVRLCGRLRGRGFDAEDLNQLVVSTFLDVVKSFPLDRRQDRTCMRLRQMTHRRVFRALRRERALRVPIPLQSVEDIDPAKLPPWPAPPSRRRGKGETQSTDGSEVVALLTSRASSVSQDKIDLVVATVVRGELLRLHVDRKFAHCDPVERGRIYQRLKRQRSRTFARLRPLFADLRCTDSSECPNRRSGSGL
jgi:DNA-directed RNA polymerase specialized sigma24 family protein